ncbi:MAG: hypothetical protein CML22_06665 [Rheinheimera sp.]|nr:hypothetical protein [Rheinheimera sp.]MBM33964.1 hypothetical protein [Rheinheimera sp.]
MEYLVNYWAFFLIATVFVFAIILNITVFSDRDVRPEGNDIGQAGIGTYQDKEHNVNRACKRSNCIRLAILASFIIFLVSLFL